MGDMLLNVYIDDPQQKAQACVIWMHGLGSDANDMKSVANQLFLTIPVRHVFIDAPVRPVTLNNHMPMRAWYDIIGIKLTDREDREGLMRSESLIRQIIDNQVTEGFEHYRIFLAGFSQGGAMALFTGLRSPVPLGGIVTLSGYLPLSSECEPVIENKNTPVFIAQGRFDPVVLPAWTQYGRDWLQSHGFQHIAWHEYPMEHNICPEEIRDLRSWFTSCMTTGEQYNGVKQ
jgi:phospholipase/carboxylesterase